MERLSKIHKEDKKIEAQSAHKISVLILTFYYQPVDVRFRKYRLSPIGDLLTSYNILKNQYPDYINKMIAGGASEPQIELPD